VQHREHGDDSVRRPKVDGVRESVKQRSADVAAHCGELEWQLANARERSTDIAQESLGETGSFVLVPPRGIVEIGLGEWPNDEPGGSFRSVAAVELLPEAFLHNLPAVTGGRIGFEVLQALVEDPTVPFGNGNRRRRGRYSVPQRLQVVDLLLDRQFVETGRRKRDGFGNEGTSSETIRLSIAWVMKPVGGSRRAAPQRQVPPVARPRKSLQ
jgi:hypothetical protein